VVLFEDLRPFERVAHITATISFGQGLFTCLIAWLWQFVQEKINPTPLLTTIVDEIKDMLVS